MIRSERNLRSSEGGWGLDVLVLSLALCGLAINLLLLVRRFSDVAAGIAGCGGAPCEEVLASRWSVIFGVPVTVFGIMAYLGLMVSLTNRGRRLHEPLLGMIAGAAFWFVFVQAVLLRKICPWCMAAHCVGFSLAGFGVFGLGGTGRFGEVLKNVALWGGAAFLGIGLLQVYGPVPALHRIDSPPAVLPTSSVHVRGEGRKVLFEGAHKSYNVATLPRRGPPDAKHVLVEYFDYQCPACRTMSGFLDALVARHPQEVAVLLLPVPLDGACNEHLAGGSPHPGSCDMARTALAVWRVKPAAFPAFHRALFDDPSPASATQLAAELIPPEQLAAARSDPWLDELIQADIADWQAFSQTTDKLPKLLIRDRRILHGLPSGEADFIRVMEQELGL